MGVCLSSSWPCYFPPPEEKAQEEAKAESNRQAEAEKAQGEIEAEFERCADRLQAFGAETIGRVAVLFDEGGNLRLNAASCRDALHLLRHFEGRKERVGQSCYELGSLYAPELESQVTAATTAAQEAVSYCRAEGLL